MNIQGESRRLPNSAAPHRISLEPEHKRSVNRPAAPRQVTAKSVGGSGGMLETADGSIIIDVPAAALDDETSLSITDLGTDLALGADLGDVTPVMAINVGPDGTTFNVPIALTFSWLDADNDGIIDGTDIGENTLRISQDGAYITASCGVEVACDAVANVFVVNIDHFSVYALSGTAADPAPVAPDNDQPPPVESSPSGGGSCFIATAAFGSYLDPNVYVLRNFRDRYLLTNAPGRAFVEFYYSTSPPLASYIAQHELLRTVTRVALTPLVYFAKYPTGGFAVFILLVAMPVAWRRRGSTVISRNWC